MRMKQVEVFILNGEVIIAQKRSDKTHGIRLAPEQIKLLCKWLDEAAEIAIEETGDV